MGIANYNGDFTGAKVDAGAWHFADLSLDSAGDLAIPQDCNGVYTIDTYSDAASDDMVSISGTLSAGRILIFRAFNDARTVVIKDNATLFLSGDFSLDNAYDTIMFLARGSNELAELGESGNG